MSELGEQLSQEKQIGHRSIWVELENWARSFGPWQRFVLSQAIQSGRLSEEQILSAYTQFLHDHDLQDAPSVPLDIPEIIIGRPASAVIEPVQLVGLSELRGINALPADAKLTFSSGLTVIYGGNGAGKSGFARLLSQGAFCRNKPVIHPNIYADEPASSFGATITLLKSDGSLEEVSLSSLSDVPELKRMSVFNSEEARSYLTEQTPLGFKPVGFEIFPEMARVYTRLTEELAQEVARRSTPRTFSNSFIAPESEVSRLVSAFGPTTDLAPLRALASFGEVEEARLAEIARQITELNSQSTATTLASLVAVNSDLLSVRTKLDAAFAAIAPEEIAKIHGLIAASTEKMAVAAATGTESFKRSFFKAVGTPEWEHFLRSAHTLGEKEHTGYPVPGDYCLLCHRPLDEEAHDLIHRFWGFLSADVQRDAVAANAALGARAEALDTVDWDFFGTDTAARSRIALSRPDIAQRLASLIDAGSTFAAGVVSSLRSSDRELVSPVFDDLSGPLDEMAKQIDEDIARLQARSAEAAIAELETERVLLRHRQVLAQLWNEIEKYAADQKWAQRAMGEPRKALSTRALTDKEGELFGTVIADGYRKRFAQECKELDCALPVEMRTQGQRGQTVRSLKIKNIYSPEKILSEGEQRAIALADFLTEVALNPAATGIILDDPVNSQDHRRKARIAARLVAEAKSRQVIVFTHDMVFLTRLIELADGVVKIEKHWVECDSGGSPGQVTLNDTPADSPQYRSTEKAKATLVNAKSASGSVRNQLVQRGMGELRRTLEEIVPHFLLKMVVRRWTDRVIVTALNKVAWDQDLSNDIVKTYEDISAYIEGHSHPEESTGAPADPSALEGMVERVNDIVKRAKQERQ